MQPTQNFDSKEPVNKIDEEADENSVELKDLKPKIKELVRKFFKKEISVNDIRNDIKGGKSMDEKHVHTIIWDDFEISGLSYADGNPNKINFNIFGHAMSIEGDAIKYISK
jgi:hypothetical protein